MLVGAVLPAGAGRAVAAEQMATATGLALARWGVVAYHGRLTVPLEFKRSGAGVAIAQDWGVRVSGAKVTWRPARRWQAAVRAGVAHEAVLEGRANRDEWEGPIPIVGLGAQWTLVEDLPMTPALAVGVSGTYLAAGKTVTLPSGPADMRLSLGQAEASVTAGRKLPLFGRGLQIRAVLEPYLGWKVFRTWARWSSTPSGLPEDVLQAETDGFSIFGGSRISLAPALSLMAEGHLLGQRGWMAGLAWGF